jgi:hypothetical protein
VTADPDDRRSSGRRSRPRRTNLALLLPAAVLTGLFANTIGVDWPAPAPRL